GGICVPGVVVDRVVSERDAAVGVRGGGSGKDAVGFDAADDVIVGNGVGDADIAEAGFSVASADGDAEFPESRHHDRIDMDVRQLLVAGEIIVEGDAVVTVVGLSGAGNDEVADLKAGGVGGKNAVAVTGAEGGFSCAD